MYVRVYNVNLYTPTVLEIVCMYIIYTCMHTISHIAAIIESVPEGGG